MGWGGGLFGLFLFLVFIAVVIWVILTVARDRHLHPHPNPHEWGRGPVEPTADALKILNERFARGEINVEEYTERRDLIKG